MKRNQPWMVGVLGILGTLMSLTGCQSSTLIEERDALFAQNKELQTRLVSADEANDALRTENARLTGELANRPTTGMIPTRPGVGGTTTVGPDGFTDIPGVETIRGQGTLTVRVPGDVLFDSGRIDLKSSAQQTLDRVAAVLKRDYAGKTIRIVGYTDTDKITRSKWIDNLELSMQRAASVHRYLEKQGVSPKQMEAVGMGPWHPESTKPKSRRVDIVVVQN